MSEVECPYCGAENIIEGEDYPDHDGDETTVECHSCEKDFVATMCISVDFNAQCSDENHEWVEYVEYREGLSGDEEHNKKMSNHLWCKHCGDCKSKEKHESKN